MRWKADWRRVLDPYTRLGRFDQSREARLLPDKAILLSVAQDLL